MLSLVAWTINTSNEHEHLKQVCIIVIMSEVKGERFYLEENFCVNKPIVGDEIVFYCYLPKTPLVYLVYYLFAMLLKQSS